VTVGAGTSYNRTLIFTFTGLSSAPGFSFQFGLSFRSAKPVCNSDFTSCTLSTWFVPVAPGLASDAVVVEDADGNLLGSMVIRGTGQGPLPAFTPGQTGWRSAGGSYAVTGMVVDPEGNVYAADSSNNVVTKTDAQGNYASVVAGTLSYVGSYSGGYSGDGDLATNALLKNPSGLALDAAGNLFICDSGNSVIRRVDAISGIISTIAGTGLAGFAGDGGSATSAQLNFPQSIAFDRGGNLFIADSSNNRIRKIDMQSGVITTVAGTGTAGYAGDGGPSLSAQFQIPSSLAFDSSGNLYIADSANQVIRVVKAAPFPASRE
jgi:sugar lactone lactonase YvrE